MATYATWRKNPTVRRLTWVCGPEPCLAREVVAAHREGAPPGSLVTFFAGEAAEPDLWDALLSYPPPGGRRAVVYEAQRLKRPEAIEGLAAARGMDAAVAVFVSSEPDFAKGKDGLAPHLAALQASRDGQLVRCCAPSAADAQAALVASWWPGMTAVAAHGLLARCGSLDAAWQACRQGVAARLEPTPERAALVCPQASPGDLADALVAGDKRRAMTLAAAVARGEIGALVGLLDWKLTALDEAREARSSGDEPGRYIPRRISLAAPSYGAARIQRLRGVLAGIDSAWRSGASVGLAESIVAQW